jgi:hypothetical protein
MKVNLLTTCFVSAMTLASTGLVLGAVRPANAAFLTWDWSYKGSGITASGTLLTDDMPDSAGFYLIRDITGDRNGDPITGLQPTGTAIPGNEPFVVDNLIGLGTQQLTGDGFGFATAAGDFVNPFFADFLSPAVYLEVFSASPFSIGMPGPEDSELPIRFSANIRAADVPESSTALGLLTFGLLAASGIARTGRQKRTLQR